MDVSRHVGLWGRDLSWRRVWSLLELSQLSMSGHARTCRGETDDVISSAGAAAARY